jgi:ubiquinone biosynthesis protein COQ9
MTDSVIEKQDRILMALLPDLAFDGWCWTAVENAAVKAGFDPAMAEAVFPGRLKDAVAHFSDWADRQMLKRLSKTDSESMRVRDRIRLAVTERLNVLQPWKEAVRLSSRFWSVPSRAARPAKLMWRTADRIWDWAGDTAQDYNRYTKRALLTGILGSTTLAWLSDQDEGMTATKDFLDRRIDNVMAIGRILGKAGKKR